MKGTFEALINEEKPVVVDFHALWCGPCKAQSPVLKAVAEEWGDRIRIIKIDVDQNQAVAAQWGVQSVPTLMVFQRGQAVYRQVGVHGKEQLMQVLRRFL